MQSEAACPYRAVTDRAGGIEDPLTGNFTRVDGAGGGAIRFDGYTTEITRAADKAPALSGGFTVEGVVALGAYPWNWCALVTQCEGEERGFRVTAGGARVIDHETASLAEAYHGTFREFTSGP